MISILHLFNLNDLVISVILKTKTKTKANIQNWGNKHFDRKPKNKKQKRIKSKSIQPKKKKWEFWDAYETTFHNLIGNMD